jgi:hypothetical protein
MPLIEEIKEIEHEPMDDGDLRYYLGDNLRLLTYRELNNYNTIEDLLPDNKSHVIILYPVISEVNGHYCTIYRLNDVIYYSCSYGMKVDAPLSFNDKYKDTPKKLSQLLNKSYFPVYFNTICFQDKKDSKIATCGSYAIFFILCMLEFNANLGESIQLLQTLKTQNDNLSYDDIVVLYINKR